MAVLIACWRNVLLAASLIFSVVVGTSEYCQADLASYLHATEGGTMMVYKGTVEENAQINSDVQMSLPIMARNFQAHVCGYTIYNAPFELPFNIVIVDRNSGCAAVRVTGQLDYHTKHHYSFEISAHDCQTGQHSPREKVHIEVKEKPTIGQKLSKDTYLVEVSEGLMVENILSLKVNNADGSQDFANVCHFHILTPQAPFVITSDGVLANTEKLDYSQHHNYILEVKAEECGKAATFEKMTINIKVLPACRSGWKGLLDHITYLAGSEKQILAPEASLKLCDAGCSVAAISAKLSLQSSLDSSQCDHDSASIKSQRHLCRANSQTMDLLPNSDTVHTSPNDGAFEFDGHETSVEVPTGKFNHTLDKHFTISTWMKHARNDGGKKENILCNADQNKMNRHHYALFVHNCRLKLLLRQEAGHGNMNTFKPAEWRWKLSQVCDNHWHHYAVSVDFPVVRLYIDGQLFESDQSTEIVDDWPLHRVRDLRFTKLVVGACWQGKTSALTQHFKGHLSGVSIVRTKSESDRVIKCLNECQERLDFHAMNEMETGMTVAFNAQLTEITISGHNSAEVGKLVSRVGYLNSRAFPHAGQRDVKVKTAVTCKDGSSHDVPNQVVTVQVVEHRQAKAVLKGSEATGANERDLEHGHHILPDLVVAIEKTEESDDVSAQFEWCMLVMEPRFVEEVEHLKLPRNLIGLLGLDVTMGDAALTIKGKNDIKHYEQLLRQIQYVNAKPQDANSRKFMLTCSQPGAEHHTADFQTRLDVVHTVPTYDEVVPVAAGFVSAQKSVADVTTHKAVKKAEAKLAAHAPQAHIASNKQFLDSSMMKGHKLGSHHRMAVAQSSATMTVVIIACIGFLLLMIMLGVMRIRAAHQKTQVVTVDDRGEMEWDNSALTITVNPLDAEAGGALNRLQGDSDDSDDDDEAGGYQDDLESSDDEDEEEISAPTVSKPRKVNELEWDNSAL